MVVELSLKRYISGVCWRFSKLNSLFSLLAEETLHGLLLPIWDPITPVWPVQLLHKIGHIRCAHICMLIVQVFAWTFVCFGKCCANICTQKCLVIHQGKEIMFNLGKAAKMWQRIVVVENVKLAHACIAHTCCWHRMQQKVCSDFWSKGVEWILAGSGDQSSAKLEGNIDIQQHTKNTNSTVG